MKLIKKFKKWFTSLRSFIIECKRVLTLTKKPTPEEFKTITKVTGIGMIIIGLIGFFIQLIKQFIIKY